MPVLTGLSIAQFVGRHGAWQVAKKAASTIKRQGIRAVLMRLTGGVFSESVKLTSDLNTNRILVADYRVPKGDVSAGEHATVGILRELCRFGYEVVFLPADFASDQHYEKILQDFGVTVITQKTRYRSPLDYLSRKAHTFLGFYFVRVDVAETFLDIARYANPFARIIFHAPDIYFLREMRQEKLKHNEENRQSFALTRERELNVMRAVDSIAVVSPVEQKLLQEYLPDAHICLFQALFAPVVEYVPTFQSRKHIFFLGSFAHSPNVDAVEWFVVKIWPLIREQLPDVEFHIIGAEIPEMIKQLAIKSPGVSVCGFVPDLQPVMQKYRLSVAPLRYGAGIKGKVAMTLGAGVPCICTDIAAEGMHLENGVHALIANDSADFANAVIQSYQDETCWNRLSQNGQKRIRRFFSENANRASLLRLLNKAHLLPLSVYIPFCQTLAPHPVPFNPPDAGIDVSVVIHAHNQWEYTRACLNSLFLTCADTVISHEIILADDGSQDETRQAEKFFPGIRCIRNNESAGFLHNCNHAANSAKGKYIFFLDSDIIVLPGWIEALHNILEKEPRAAIAASKTLFQNGAIQNAGGVIFNNGTAYAAGCASERDNPFYSIARETDCTPPVAILVRKSFWESAGGFDESCKNPDTAACHLAMAARMNNLRVVYQPRSEVIRMDSASRLSSPSTNTPLQQEAVFIEKWHATLQKNHLPEREGMLAAMRNADREPLGRRHNNKDDRKLHILYFSPFPSHPDSHGNQKTIQNFGRYFQEKGCVAHFVLLESGLYSQQDADNMRAAWDTFDLLPYSYPLRPDSQAAPFDSWFNENLGNAIYALCHKYDIEMVFCSYIFHSKMLEYVPDRILKVIDTHDKMGNRHDMLREKGLTVEFFSCSPEEESAYLQRADIVVARREEESKYFDEMTGQRSAIVIPHVEEPRFLSKKFPQLRNIGLVASANRINLFGIRDFLKVLNDALKGGAPPFDIHIAGRVGDLFPEISVQERMLFSQPGVKMHGFVENIAQFYGQMDLILNPIMIGTGINVKTVEAMAYGMPLLSTQCGIKGIETENPYHELATVEDFVNVLLDLSENVSELARLAEISRATYSRFYSEHTKGLDFILAQAKSHSARYNTKKGNTPDEPF